MSQSQERDCVVVGRILNQSIKDWYSVIVSPLPPYFPGLRVSQYLGNQAGARRGRGDAL
jgi:hypothetical protein